MSGDKRTDTILAAPAAAAGAAPVGAAASGWRLLMLGGVGGVWGGFVIGEPAGGAEAADAGTVAEEP